MLIEILKIVAGLAALIYAADRLVKSAVRISKAFGVSVVLIGAVVVGFGTSVPEFVVSALASLEGNLDLAVSNVVSSNTANVTLVLGSAAVLSPLVSRWRIIRREGALMFAAVVALTAMLAGGSLNLWEGFLLVGFLGLAIWMMIRWSADDPEAVLAQIEDIDEPTPDEDSRDFGAWRTMVGKEILVGIAALVVTVVAADFLLDGVVGVGARLGLSAVVLGLITGVGTSLPELAASISAARHREPELVLGNVLGSNVFNSLGVIGLATILGPGHLYEITPILLGIMVTSSLIAGIFALTGQRINRYEGVALLVGFLAYAVYAFR
jgi:cation:H+ antiporter